MKYYIYVSEAKVDMMFSQIPRRTRDRIATELKFDLKLFSTTFKESETKDTLYSKLKLVVDYLQKNFDIGTIDSPKEYFMGNLPMRWGPFPTYEEKPSVVYFVGHTNSTILGLGGSLKHVIGYQGDLSFSPISASNFTPYLLSVLEGELDLTETEKESEDWRMAQAISYPPYEDRNEMALSVVADSLKELRGPEQQLEFLARKLIVDERVVLGTPIVVLGTPIYVALADMNSATM